MGNLKQNIITLEKLTNKKIALVEATLDIEAIKSRQDKISTDIRDIRKGRPTNKGLNHLAASRLKRLEREWNSLQKQIDKAPFADSIQKVKQVLRNIGLKRISYSSTAIRGYTTASKGYEFADYDPNKVNFSGIGLDTFNQIKQALLTAGVTISRENPPAKSIGGPTTASITFN